nr:immunoglobulin heavy chain junction region [Macaca mulatta]
CARNWGDLQLFLHAFDFW